MRERDRNRRMGTGVLRRDGTMGVDDPERERNCKITGELKEFGGPKDRAQLNSSRYGGYGNEGASAQKILSHVGTQWV